MIDIANITSLDLAPHELRKKDAWWRAANYLNVGKIHLTKNPCAMCQACC